METQEAQTAGQGGQRAPSGLPLNDSETYRMMVLRFEQSEEDFDQKLAQTAVDLGIDVPEPPNPHSLLDIVANDASPHQSSSAPPEPSITPEPSVQSSSHTSDSTNPQSDSSNEYRRHAKTPSLTATSITSVASVSSVASQTSHLSKVKKGIRRISTLRRRKPSILALPMNFAPTHSDRPASQRVATADEVLTTPNSSPHVPHASTKDQSSTPVTRHREINSASYTPATYNAQPPRPPFDQQKPYATRIPSQAYQEPEFVPPPSPSTLEAQHRSLRHPLLKKLRTVHLQEQLRFISFQASQTRLLHTAHLEAKRSALDAYKARQSHLETTHSDALASLEHRHLSAEVDLWKGLGAERKACDVKLKHMQAYCNPRSTIEGMPRREVTKADYRQLEQQYHIRNGMDNLHASKINVLREKQAKQLERILAKQEAELAEAEAHFEQENRDLERRFRDEDKSQMIEFAQRKKRLVRRWDLMEGIERRRLELETEEEYGRLPDIAWGEEDLMKGRKSSPNSATSIGEASEMHVEKYVLLDGSEKAKYDAMNMI